MFAKLYTYWFQNAIPKEKKGENKLSAKDGNKIYF